MLDKTNSSYFCGYPSHFIGYPPTGIILGNYDIIIFVDKHKTLNGTYILSMPNVLIDNSASLFIKSFYPHTLGNMT